MLGLIATKVLSLTSMGAASLLLGLLPLWLRSSKASSSSQDASCPRHAAAAGPVLTALLSFGARALLATALVHMLVEASEVLPRTAPVALLAGFLALYLVDELVQRVLGHSPAAARAHRTQPHTACPVDEPCPSSKSPRAWRRENYGSLDESVAAAERCSTASESGSEAEGLLSAKADSDQGHSPGHHLGGAGSASCWGLLLALCIHSVIEGLAVGLEETPEQVLFLLGAVSSHKLVVSFCLGAELVGGGVALLPHVVAVLVFALGSAAGVGVGMILYALPGASTADPLLLPVLQAAAGGTLLYVTLAEVLPRERARSQNNFPRRLLQFTSFAVGVVVITALILCLPDVHNQPDEPWPR